MIETIEKLSGDKSFILGLILGAGTGYVGGELSYLTNYLLHKKILLQPFFMNITWGILLICCFFYLLKKTQEVKE